MVEYCRHTKKNTHTHTHTHFVFIFCCNQSLCVMDEYRAKRLCLRMQVFRLTRSSFLLVIVYVYAVKSWNLLYNNNNNNNRVQRNYSSRDTVKYICLALIQDSIFWRDKLSVETRRMRWKERRRREGREWRVYRSAAYKFWLFFFFTHIHIYVVFEPFSI